MERAAIYARSATSEEELLVQLEEARGEAEALGLTVVAELSEVFSGATLDRPELGQLRKLVKTGEIRVIICKTPDRLSRRSDQIIPLLTEIAEHGVGLYCTALKDWLLSVGGEENSQS